MLFLLTKERLDYIDCAKGMGILFVVIAHHLQDSENILWWIYSFHMPLFFLISGYLYEYRRKESTIKEVIISGLKTFIWPYCTFNIIIILWWIILGAVLNAQPEESIVEIILRFLTTYGYHAMWFLPTMFQVSFTSKIFKSRKRWVILIFSVAVGCMLSYLVNSTILLPGYWRYVAMYLGRFMLGLSFVEIGRYIFMLVKKFNSSMEWVILIVSLCISLLFYKENIFVSMVFCRIGNPIMYYLIACSGSICILLLAKKITNTWIGQKLCFWGKNSLIVMAVHMDISIEIAWIILGITNLSTIFSFRDTSILAILIELVILFYIVKIVNRYAKILISLPKNC